MKKTILSLASATALLGALAAPTFAASTFHLVVPLGARTQVQEPVETITVTLAGAELPKATINKAYSESLLPYLSVTGDSALDKSAARWSLAEGSLPAGLALDATTGAVAGTPTTKTTSPASFTVLATYKGSDGQAVYTIEVGGESINVREVVSGNSHTCAITDVGGVKCWGGNYYGELGNDSNADSLTPVDVKGLGSGVVSLALGNQYTCAVTTAGSAKCWGQGSSGQLGNNSTAESRVPVDVATLGGDASVVVAGSTHACAITSQGAVKCWGENQFGQLGNKSSVLKSVVPVGVSTLDSGVASIASGQTHVCVVTTLGAAKCWGQGSYGQLGNNSTAESSRAPVNVSSLSGGVATIAGGGVHTCAVTVDGVAKCWGYNNTGQLGTSNTLQSLVPVNVANLGRVNTISVGQYHSCALTTEGAVKCWGQNNRGQLGNNSTSRSLVPVDVVGLGSAVQQLSSNFYHTCAVTNGLAKCWGQNAKGQLGNLSKVDSLIPVDVQGFQ